MTFRERYMAGITDFEELFDLTDQWNFSEETCTLREYLGLTAEEEDVWISQSDEALEELLEREKSRKIFFTDLDDTLLNDQKEITPGNRQAIRQLLDAGHVAVISTGRALPSARKQARRLGLIGKGCYIICYNGGQIFDTEQQRLIYQKSVPLNYVREIFDEAARFGIDIQTYSDTDVLAEKDNPNLQEYLRIQELPCQIVDDVVQALNGQEPAKLLALDYRTPERIPLFRQYINDKYQGKLDVFLSHPALLELVPPGVNKGNAVRFLCDYLGIPLKNSVAAGDAENDLSMIKAAHIGAAMCNGVPLLKEQADYITTSDHNHDGVAEIINQFILNK